MAIFFFFALHFFFYGKELSDLTRLESGFSGCHFEVLFESGKMPLLLNPFSTQLCFSLNKHRVFKQVKNLWIWWRKIDNNARDAEQREFYNIIYGELGEKKIVVEGSWDTFFLFVWDIQLSLIYLMCVYGCEKVTWSLWFPAFFLWTCKIICEAFFFRKTH